MGHCKEELEEGGGDTYIEGEEVGGWAWRRGGGRRGHIYRIGGACREGDNWKEGGSRRGGALGREGAVTRNKM